MPRRAPIRSPPLPATATTLSETNTTNTIVSKSTTPNLGTPDIRLGIFAKPGQGATATGANGASTNRPLQNALKDFHPVRDVVKAVSDTAKNALGKDDNSSAGSDPDS